MMENSFILIKSTFWKIYSTSTKLSFYFNLSFICIKKQLELQSTTNKLFNYWLISFLLFLFSLKNKYSFVKHPLILLFFFFIIFRLDRVKRKSKYLIKLKSVKGSERLADLKTFLESNGKQFFLIFCIVKYRIKNFIFF